ncbi:SH3 domain-containing protein [Anaeromicropila populeti]|uniref:Beta-N-acetylglucosaminidase n=1 Tax=Anaeromicropila populeti TaxID=37658 RepID=A0A1I6LUH2_9FIRM|nr:SH3 domain-containing protein [Anaeromicropila populeti]SFS07117.1 Beta-N-acetylglucosaminidase [Anaeromicropila populeti]
MKWEKKKRIRKLVYITMLCTILCTGLLFTLKGQTVASGTTSFTKRIGYVTTTTLNVRKSASTSAAIVTRLRKYKAVIVIGEMKTSKISWYKISVLVNGKRLYGYVAKQYIRLYKTTVSNQTYTLAKINKKSVPLYLTANSYDRKRTILPINKQVIILGSLTVNSVKWSKITVVVSGRGMNGYVPTKYLTNLKATAANTTSITAYTNTTVIARKIAATFSKKTASIANDKKVTIKASLVVEKRKWYKCTFVSNGNTVTGYILQSQVTISGEAGFSEQLSKFPESYHSYLEALHEKYPNWSFVAVNTGLDWNEVISQESKFGRNVIQSNLPNGGGVGTYSAPFSYLSTEPGAYSWSTDKYTLCDGTNYFTAKDSVIAYYMDPRNSLNENSIFQFETLSYDAAQKRSVVANILSNTFMSGTYRVVDSLSGKTVSGSYADTFMEAGEKANASPYFLAVRVKQEVGLNGSGSVSGTYSGYQGYYNYYNIGANDSATGGAIANGLKYASSGTTYNRPWTNPYKAILGGAEYIAAAYINKGQNTLYTQKFNVAYEPYYVHQYMTNVKAPNSEARLTFQSYQSMGIVSDSFVFYIPVYSNMPSKACSLPKETGNPNSYLKSLTVKNGSKNLLLTPTFKYTTTDYTMIVPNQVSQVTIGAEAVSKYAGTSGTGTFSLTAGQAKTIDILCTAQDGTSTKYSIRIVRQP